MADITYNNDYPITYAIGQSIDKYIITEKRIVVDNNADNGNIIIWANHTDGLIPDSEYGEINNEENLAFKKYTDLYIGDEHVAGGYGFDTPYTRSQILELPEKISEIETRLKNITITGTDSPTNEPTESPDNNITIDPNYNSININDNKYELSLNETTNVLSIITTQKPAISNVILTCKIDNNKYVEYNPLDENPSYLGGVFQGINISYITFDYDGSKDLSSFYISYNYNIMGRDFSDTDKMSGKFGYGNDIIGKFNAPLSLNIEEPNSYCNVTELFRVHDPNVNPEIIQKRYKIDFSTNSISQRLFNNLSEKESEITLKLNCITLDYTKVSANIYTFRFTYPCFYGLNFNYAAAVNPDVSILSNFYIDHNTKQKLFTFEHGAEPVDAFIYVPTVILNKPLDIKDINLTLKDTNIRFYWNIIKNNFNEFVTVQFNGSKIITYYALVSPQLYKGTVKWYISLDGK